jgi:hypothetical protein
MAEGRGAKAAGVAMVVAKWNAPSLHDPRPASLFTGDAMNLDSSSAPFGVDVPFSTLLSSIAR